jgi:transcriptional regulator with XRE-family HTH domain
MRLGEKIRYLREVEGTLRQMQRAMTQLEVSRAIESELNKKISQSYLSQIESGTRPHLTNTSRMTLARFFKVHPGYLVDDPEGFHTELLSDLTAIEDKLDLWLISGAERFRQDSTLRCALLSLAKHSATGYWECCAPNGRKSHELARDFSGVVYRGARNQRAVNG